VHRARKKQEKTEGAEKVRPKENGRFYTLGKSNVPSTVRKKGKGQLENKKTK